MASDWVAPVSTSAVGIVGIIFTYRNGRRQQETALAVAQQQADAQVAVAREERQQRRLETAYMELLQVLSHTYEWVKAVYPMLTATREEYTMPPMPELPGGLKADALITAYWSPRIQQLMTEWDEAVVEVFNLGAALGIALRSEHRGDESGRDSTEYAEKLPAAREAVWKAGERIREQVRLELLGQHDGQAERESI
jgi:hypothetical protein